MRHPELAPTFAGCFAVLVWGLTLPIDRTLETQIGIPAVLGTVMVVGGLLGLLSQFLRKQPWPEKAVFKNPYLYGRWIFFAVHELFIYSAILIVQKAYVPFVILLNYLWPTAIILCSIMFAGVRVTRLVPFIAGTLIVIVALSIEILNKDVLTIHLFERGADCLAYVLAAIGAIAWGIYSALSRRAGRETGGGSVIPFFQLSFVFLLPLSFVPGWGTWDHLTIGLAGFLSLWCMLQFVTYVTWDLGMRKGNIVALSLFADFIPWLSLATAHFLLGVDISQRTILSAVCLVAGAMIARYGTLVKKQAPEAELKELAAVHPPSD